MLRGKPATEAAFAAAAAAESLSDAKGLCATTPSRFELAKRTIVAVLGELTGVAVHGDLMMGADA